MDPYLEGNLWPDVHHRLAAEICDLLVPQISPDFVARLNIYTIADTDAFEDIGIMYPDVEILKRKIEEAGSVYGNSKPPIITPITATIPAVQTIEVRIPVIEIRDRGSNQLITAIEILSPVNKRKPGLEPYLLKRDKLYKAGIHFIEIDLLRRGRRPVQHAGLPESDYLVALTRATQSSTDIWAFGIRDSLPVIPVPLLPSSEDAVLDLGMALKAIYERSRYDLSIQYEKTPPAPVFPEYDQQWILALLKQ